MRHPFPPRVILVPTDLSPTSMPAFQFARVWHKQFGGDIHVLHARHFDPPPYFSSGQIQSLTRELKRSAKLATEFLHKESTSALGFDAQVAVVETPPVAAILQASDALNVDMIVMGTHGRRGANRLWLGSVAERILRESLKPILAVRQGMVAASFGHVLCPVSVSEVGQAALEYAAAIAQAGNLRLTVLHALEDGNRPPDCSLVPEAVKRRCIIEEITFQGDAARGILTAATELKPDMIVMGAERKSSTFGGLFSSTTERVMQWAESPCW